MLPIVLSEKCIQKEHRSCSSEADTAESSMDKKQDSHIDDEIVLSEAINFICD